MSNFKVGDKVRYLRYLGNDHLKIGGIYTIDRVGMLGFIRLEESPFAYGGDRFELVDSTLITSIDE